MLSKVILDENMKGWSILVKGVPGWEAVPSPKGKNYFLLATIIRRTRLIILSENMTVDR
jgi:hypothetical protein